MSVQRLAGQAWNGYKNNLLVQDIVETAVATLGIAGAQALFTDMSPEEILMSSGVGVGAAMVGRPMGDRAGRAIGRMADKRYPQASKGWQNNLDESMAAIKAIGGEGMDEVMQAKMQHHFADGRGAFEGTGSIYGRQYGDNLAQLAVGAVAPSLLGSGEEETAAVAAG